MNSRVLILLAALLLLGASVAAYMGYRTTVEARDVAAKAEARAVAAAEARTRGQIQILVVKRAIPAFQPLTADDISIDFLKVAPPGSFRKPEEVVGLAPQTNLEPGTILSHDHLNPGGEVARLLRPGERAMAIAVNAVVGGGGFVQPGDLVDILLYLGGDDSGRESVQVVLRAVRVISFGADLINPQGEAPETAKAEKGEKGGKPAVQRQARTAVLAIAREDVPRLLLASNLGTLRLAIVPTAEMLSPDALAQSATVKPLPAVGVATVPSTPTAVPEQRQYLTSSVLKGAVARTAPVRSSGGGGSAPRRAVAPAEPPVMIIRGMTSEVAQ